jgi:hypothetical protein
MLLQCERDGPPPGEAARLAAGWLPPETLESLLELNELALGLLAEQAAAPAPAPALLRQVGEPCLRLDAAARRRAAGAPYLLVEAGFADLQRWRRAAQPQVGDADHVAYAAFFTVPGAVAAARLVLTYAWHLARVQPAAARLLLGMPSACAVLIGGCTLRHIHRLAELHPEWLRPRWPTRPQVWRALLLAAASGDARALERAHLHGLTLLAGEARGVGRAAGS